MSFIKGLCLGLLASLLCFILLVFIFALTLETTLLKPHFMADEFNKLDICVAAGKLLSDQIPLDETLSAAVNLSIKDLEPWIRQQLNKVIYSSYDYWLGNTREFTLTLDLDIFRTRVLDNLEKMYLQSPPAGFMELPKSEQEKVISEVRQGVLDMLPSQMEITGTDLGDDIILVFDRIRDGVVLIKAVFRWSMGIVIVLFFLLMLLLRRFNLILLVFGAVLVLDGILALVLSLVLQNVVLPQIYPQNLIPELQVWIPVMINDALSPVQIAGVVLVSTGMITLTAAYVLHLRRESAAG